jgi:glucose-1-phosphate cytidylyltransferase
MRYYAHFGHKDFVLALGYRGDQIREYFLKYQETLTNDFVLSNGKNIDLVTSDIQDWRITFVDTGMHSNIGQRLLRVKKYLQGEEMFLANYADGLSDLPLNQHIDEFRNSDAIARFIAVKPAQSFHIVESAADGYVTGFGRSTDTDYWVNAGYFVLRQSIFDHIQEGDELVEQPFERLIQKRKLTVDRYSGFWQQMDTLKDKIAYDRLEARGECPWMVWRNDSLKP